MEMFMVDATLKVFYFNSTAATAEDGIAYPANIRLDEDSWRCLASSSSEDVSRHLDEDQYIRLGHTSWRRFQEVLKTSSRGLQDVLQKRLQSILKTSSKHLQDVFKTFSRRIQNIFKTSCKNVFKTSSRRLQDVLKTFLRRLQDILKRYVHDIFKTYNQDKLFLLARFQNVLRTYSKCFCDALQRRLSIAGFA